MPKLPRKEKILQLKLVIKTTEIRIKNLTRYGSLNGNTGCLICVRAEKITPEDANSCDYCIGKCVSGGWWWRFDDVCLDRNWGLAMSMLIDRLEYWQKRLKKFKKQN